MEVSVSLKNVAVDVKKSPLLHDVSFDLHPGDIVQLIGENLVNQPCLESSLAY
ncbi:hypothetical protein lacNasYZ03_06340 [Lactobacillus nasalidis]|uniref:ABC transporter ATP-binding protein n=1 Tax=Lactobacillus nasalidis TaxID=2797258 RepID=A0ABQ3W7V9_9LACO|nr:hypothetical protein lacNasYZ01_07610 [Lactobacillus nasalidis]GHV99230.1 hypothetical protein lacNasYZ02_06600 [Lactobacillus nasalidis]GHW00947.1 hypothetical protein lacNasYZ03_06340 [Lactobacillus nasalidis]